MALNKTAIDWPWKPLLTWNPITGCRRNPPCPYCYARRIHERFHPGVPFSDIVLHRDRLLDPLRHLKPCHIFVGSMSDIEFWTDEQIGEVANTCRYLVQHDYIFLSKSAAALDRMGEAIGNSADMHHFGATVTGEAQHIMRDERNINFPCKYGHSFLSVEPLLGPVPITVDVERALEWVIVGAMTGPGAVVPKREWIDAIRDSVPAEKIYWKNSMRQFGVDNAG